MIAKTSQSGHTTYGLIEFAIDSPEDVNNLPLDVPMGSTALCIKPLTVYVLNGEKEWVNIIETETIPASDEEEETVAGDVVINGVSYETIVEAFQAAQDGDVITLTQDVTTDGFSMPEGAFSETGLTLDFNGHTYTCNSNYAGSAGTQRQVFQLLQGNKVTFKNGTIESSGARMLIQNYSDLTLDNMTLNHLGHTEFPDKTPYALSDNNGTIVIKDTTINGCEDGFAFDVCRYKSYPSVNVTVTGDSVINGNVEISASNSDPKEGMYLALMDGTLNGELIIDNSAAIALANHPEKAGVIKVNTFNQPAPIGYEWTNNGGVSTLTKVNE